MGSGIFIFRCDGAGVMNNLCEIGFVPQTIRKPVGGHPFAGRPAHSFGRAAH
jgi:hypothetical protein